MPRSIQPATPATMPLLPPGIQYRQVHNAKGVVRTTLEQIPEWVRAVNGLAALDEAPRLTVNDDSANQLAGLIAAAIDAGDGVPADIVDRATELAAAARGRILAAEALASARAEFGRQLDEAVHSSAEQIFTALSDQHDNVVAKIRKIPDPAALRSADLAISTDRVKDYTAWHQLLSEYAEIRAAHTRLLRLLAGAITTFRECRYIADPEQVWPKWITWRRGTEYHDGTALQRPLLPPWPHVHGEVNDQVACTHEFLSWAIESDARLWCPTPAQLKAKGAELEAALQTSAIDLSPRERGIAPATHAIY